MSTPPQDDATLFESTAPRAEDGTLHEGTPRVHTGHAPTEAIPLSADPSDEMTLGVGDSPLPAELAEEVPEDLKQHGRYRVTELLGKGGMGLVFKAEHRIMDRIVALKVIHHHLISDTATIERFRREVQAAARLRHPNIVSAYDAEQAGQTHFLVMEYVEGQTLTDILQAKGPMSVQQACDCARQVALGLEYAHTRGMIHRDIKPDNLMLSRKGVIKILDFGLARLSQVKVTDSPTTAPDLAGLNTQLTLAGSVMGTPDYLAPEQASDSSKADIRADIYALGCTLYQLLTGQLPFPGGTTMDKLVRHLKEEPPVLRAARPEVPAELSAIVQRMMARDPARRFQTPTEVVAALAPFAEPARKRRNWLAAVAVVVIPIMCAALAFFLFGRGKPGHLIVDSEAADVTVHATPETTGKTGTTLGLAVTETGKEFALPPGTYRLALAGGRADLHLAPTLVEIQAGRSVRAAIVRINPTGPGAWKTVPLPDPATVAARPSAADRLPRYTPSKDEAALLRLPPGAELAAILGRPFFPLTGQSCFPSFNREGDPVAVPSGHDVILYRTATGKVSKVFRGHTANIQRAELTPDARRLVTGSWDKTARLWATVSGEELQRWTFPARVWGVQFCPKGRILAVTSLDGTFLAYDRIDEKLIRRIEIGQPVTGVAIHPTGKVAAVGLNNGQVRFVDLTGKEKEPLKEGDVPVVKVDEEPHVVIAFDAAGTRMAVASDLELKVGQFDLNKLQMRQAWSAETGGAGLLAFTPEGTQLLASPHVYPDATKPHLVHILAAADGKKLDQIQMRPRGSHGCYNLSPDGRWLGGVALTADRELTLYDLKEKRFLAQSRRHTGAVQALSFSPDDRFVVSGGQDAWVKVWDLARGELHTEWPGHVAEIRDLAFHRDGNSIALAGKSPSVAVLSFPGGQVQRQLAQPGSAEKVAFLRGGGLLSAALVGKVLLFEPGTTESRESFAASGQAATAVACDGTGRVVATGSDKGFIQVWQRGRSRPLHLLTAHDQPVTSLVVSPDNRWLFSTGDRTVRVWDFEKGKLHARFEFRDGQGRCLAVSPDGRWLAAAGTGRNIVLADLSMSPPSLHQIALPGTERGFAALAISPNGRYLAAGMADGTVSVIRLAGPGQVFRLPAKSSEPDESETIEISSEVVFGDRTWSDYTVDVDVRLLKGGGEIGIKLHHTAPNSWNTAVFGGWNNTNHAFLVARPEGGPYGLVQLSNRAGAMVPGKMRFNEWYHIKVEVSGTSAKAFLGDTLIMATNSLPYKAGQIGLRPQATTLEVKNLVVRNRQGNVLHRGVPKR